MKKRVVLLAILLGIASTVLFAQTTGTEVMEAVYNRPKGNSMTAELVMTITNSRGSIRERSIQQYLLDENGIEKKMMFFITPADVKGTSFMTWAYNSGQDDDRWIYLPALRRIRRIASDSSNDSFMGSDFTYEDMSMRHPDLDSHRVVKEEQINGKTYLVVESTPKNADFEYSLTRNWIDPETNVGIRKEFINGSNNVVRRLSVEGTEEVNGFWVITDMTMENLEKKTSTRIQMKNVTFDTGLSDSFFSERQMQRGDR